MELARRICGCRYAGIKLVEMLPGDRCVDGLALLEGYLFILRGNRLTVGIFPDHPQIEPSSGCLLLHYIVVNQLDKHCWNDLASCELSRCLFISDHRHKCVYKLASPTHREVSKFADVPHKPHGLSVTRNLTLLLTCRDDHMLMEIGSQSGMFLRQIPLPSEIDCPYHAVQLTSDHFVVCYGTTGKCEHGVAVVDSGSGIMEHSYTQLHYPSHVNVDTNNDCVYVSDHYQHRVVKLNMSLEFIGAISVGTKDWPWRLCMYHEARRLIIGLDKGGVLILELS